MKRTAFPAAFASAVVLTAIPPSILAGCGNRGQKSAPDAQRHTPPNQEVSVAAQPAPSAAELSSQAQKAFSRDAFAAQLSPMFPAVWPPAGDSAVLEWFAYESQPLPSGIIAYQVKGPVSKVSFILGGTGFRVEPIDKPTATGSDSPGPGSGRPDMASAEQALVEVLLGHRAPESARASLSAYSKWADATPVIGADMRKRKAAFFRWLESGQP
jgi:predicted small lipoprotein YifL